jgi:hypothetical protein
VQLPSRRVLEVILSAGRAPHLAQCAPPEPLLSCLLLWFGFLSVFGLVDRRVVSLYLLVITCFHPRFGEGESWRVRRFPFRNVTGGCGPSLLVCSLLVLLVLLLLFLLFK